MSENTWILLTDGYYIKLLYVPEGESSLRTYREADFDNSSDITYNLITRYKNDSSNNQAKPDAKDVEAPGYALKLMSEFLGHKLEENAFDSLIVIAPDGVQKVLDKNFSNQLLDSVKYKISGDYMNLSLDKLQETIAEKT